MTSFATTKAEVARFADGVQHDLPAARYLPTSGAAGELATTMPGDASRSRHNPVRLM
jgi:hypothetical protein